MTRRSARAALLRAVAPCARVIEDWRQNQLPQLPRNVKKALPVAGFFIALFWIVVALFVVSHVMPVSCYTTLFNVRHRKYNSPAQYLRFFAVSYLALAARRAWPRSACRSACW